MTAGNTMPELTSIMVIPLHIIGFSWLD